MRAINGRGALIGLDIGTGGARALAVDATGAIVAQASSQYPLSSPRPGWSEQDPEHWWAAAQAVLRSVAAELREPPLGLGLTGQMHGAVFLDGRDAVIRPAMLWNDQRTARQCGAMTEKVGRDRLIEISGNPAVTGFQAPKILWLRDEEPASYARVARVLLPKDFIRLRLTGHAATDASDASGTSLLDLRRRDWSGELLDGFDIPRRWLPEVYEGPAPTGAISASAAGSTGLPEGLLVAAGAGDNAAAAVGT
ncbi:MAG TPA: FGGY family carbohydrate kinase, partial [Patescibacteria group bacterium]|nr:FGGY family carbohydrate kinase [Patescibacteria group bacterium]